MDSEKLKYLTIEELQKQENNMKRIVWLFVPIIGGLLYFNLQEYQNGKDLINTMSIITICAIGGLVSLFPNMSSIRREIDQRR